MPGRAPTATPEHKAWLDEMKARSAAIEAEMEAQRRVGEATARSDVEGCVYASAVMEAEARVADAMRKASEAADSTGWRGLTSFGALKLIAAGQDVNEV